jgi:hypothetical protein
MHKTDIKYLIQQAKRLPRQGQADPPDEFNLGDALKNLGKGLGPAALQKAFGDLNKAIDDVTQQVTLLEQRNQGLQSSLNLTVQQAGALGQRLDELAVEFKLSNSQLRKFQESLEGVAAGFGNLSEKQFANTKDYTTFLAKVRQANILNLGLTEEQANKFTKFLAGSFDSVENAEKYNNELAQTVKALEDATGQTGRYSVVIENIAEAGAEIQMAFASNPESITKAIFLSDRLGLSLAEVKKTGDQFLDIESSISSEITAQLLGGTKINTAAYRRAAASQDLEQQAIELTKIIEAQGDQLITNRFLREEIAGLLGIESDKVLEISQNLKANRNISGETTDEYLKQLQTTKDLTTSAEALTEEQNKQSTIAKNAFQNELDYQKVLQKQFANQEELITDASNTLQEIQKETGGQLAETLSKATVSEETADAAGAIAGALTTGKTIFGTIKELFTGDINLKSEQTDVEATGPLSIITKGGSTERNDVLSMPTGTSGYGSRMLFGPEGAISLNNKDMVVAGTDLASNNNSSGSPAVNVIIKGAGLDALIDQIEIRRGEQMNA